MKTLLNIAIIICIIGVKSAVFADTGSDTDSPTNTTTPDYQQDKDIRNYLTGKFKPSRLNTFVKVPTKYVNANYFYLRKETLEAYKLMHAAAAKDGIKLNLRSATRNYENQKRIWNGKWHKYKRSHPNPKDRALKILTLSSMPGTSRHHWGTDIDLNSFDNAWFSHGKGLKIYNWLKNHASKYGFCQPYTAKNELRPTGYNEEKWHWSYTPLSIPMIKDAERLLDDNKISGFSGSQLAPRIEVVKNYILGVNPSCR